MKRYKIETERADLFDVNMMIVMSVKIRQTASKEQIESAFRNAVAAHEILNTRVVLMEDGEAYYEPYDAAKNRLSFTNLSIVELVEEQERIRFRVEEGEYLRVFAVETDTAEFYLHFLMHHLGGDGKSLCYFIESFLRSLNGEQLHLRELILLNADTLPKRSRPPFATRLFVKKCNSNWKKEKRVLTFTDMERVYQKFWETHRTQLQFEKIGEEELSSIRQQCHKKRIGFTSYFLAEQLRENRQWKNIGLAVDGRLQKNRSMGNQVTGISFRYRYNHRKTLLDNAAAIDRKMKRLLSSMWLKYFILHFVAGLDPTLVDAVNLEYTGDFHSKTSDKIAGLLGYGRNTKDLSLTNLTVLDIPVDYGRDHIASFWFIPPVVSYGKNVMGIVTVNGRAYITKHQYVNNEH